MSASMMLFLAAWLGIGIASVFKKGLPFTTSMLLAFSGAFLFSISVLHLIPDLYNGHNHLPGLLILIGFITQFVLDFLSHGVEHGHHHSSDFKKGHIPAGIFIGLFLHALLEGIPTANASDMISFRSFTLAVALHKLPVSIVLYLLLKEAGMPPFKLWTALLSFSLMSPLGNLLGIHLPFLAEWMPYVSAFVIGIFLHVSTTILYESNRDHRFNLTKLSVVVVGAALAYLTVLH